jgi:sugar phosphate isomerase/epimerase
VLAGEAAKAGVTIAIESALPTLEVTRLIDATRSSHVGAYWDMANGMSLGFDPLEDVRTLGSRISRVHAKEFQKPADAGQSRQPGSYPGLNPVVLGQGDVPIADILRELKRVGYKGFITLETGAFGDRKESARAARQVLADAARGI